MDRRTEPDDGSTELELDLELDLEALRSTGADLVPEAAVVDAHRDALAAAIARERVSPRRRQVLRRAVVVAAAIPALAGSALLVGRASGPGPGGDDLGDVTLAASSAFEGAPRCGSAPPPEVLVPDGFSGPIDGPSPDSDRPVGPDQMVRHWTSATASIELRWYADAEATPPAVAEARASLPDAGASLDPTHPVADGVDDVIVTLGRSGAASDRRYGRAVYGTEAGEADDPCTWAQVTVFDGDPEQVNDTLDEATRLCEGEIDILDVHVQVYPNMDERDQGVMSSPDLWDECDG
jgi:hypothetical protein